MKYILNIILLLFSLHLFADPVDSTEAKQVALNYYSSFINQRGGNSINLKKTIVKQYKNITTRYTFVFDNLDYIIVSADNSTVPIFAYSIDNSYNENQIPASCEFWMQSEYDELVYYVRTNSISNANTISQWNNIKQKIFNQTRGAVSPLTKTKWGQTTTNDGECPGYNNNVNGNSSCNCGHCTAGCVAIAMAQIMKFWNHSGTSFDWCNMPDYLIKYDYTLPYPYTRPYYEAERNAIAALVSDCGIKANMDYCSSSCASSSTIGDARQALQNSYDYSSDMLHRYRWLTISWKPKMRKSLDDGNPILYGGNSSDAGHAFVCDGYQNDNYFHFNWGWNGYSDGYFYIDDDDGSPVIDYKKWQEAIFYIHPNQQSAIDCNYCNESISVSNTVTSNNPYNQNFPMITWLGLSPFFNYNFFFNPIKPLFSNIISENGETRLEYYEMSSGTMLATNVTIPNKIDVKFNAYNNIVLKNFKTEPDAIFSAYTSICPYNNGKLNNLSKNNSTLNNLIIEKEFTVFPNPNNGNMQVSYEIPLNTNGTFEVYNMIGDKLFSYPLVGGENTFSISHTDLNPGIYFYRAIAGDKLIGKDKIVVIK